MSDQKLRVWWIPQVPMSVFYIDVASIEEGVKIIDTLAEYDLFQYHNNVKPDYCNAGGLQMFDPNDDHDGPEGSWVDWYYETDDNYYDDPKDFLHDSKYMFYEPPTFITDIMNELHRATTKFPTWPTDPLHAVAIINEECGELNKAILEYVYEPEKTHLNNIRSEAIQTAAVAIRFIRSISTYKYVKSEQHKQ